MIKYEQIQKANSEIKTTDVKGKDYAEVNQRINAFRKVYPQGGIESEMLLNDARDGKNCTCIIQSTVKDDEGRILGTGLAYEVENNSFINKTSYIENCETSAVGRALGMCGFGIDTSVASYEEVANAVKQQEVKKVKEEIQKPASDLDKKTFKDTCDKLKVDYKTILGQVGMKPGDKMTQEQHGKAMIILKDIEENK